MADEDFVPGLTPAPVGSAVSCSVCVACTHQDMDTIQRAACVSAKCARPTSPILSNGGSEWSHQNGTGVLCWLTACLAVLDPQ